MHCGAGHCVARGMSTDERYATESKVQRLKNGEIRYVHGTTPTYGVLGTDVVMRFRASKLLCGCN